VTIFSYPQNSAIH